MSRSVLARTALSLWSVTLQRSMETRWRPSAGSWSAQQSLALAPITVIRMHPHISRDLAFPDRRVARAPNRAEWNAGFGLTPMALHLKPTITTVEALPDSRRGLRRSAVALHSQRPGVSFRTVCLAGGPMARWRACSTFIFAALMRQPQITSRDSCCSWTGLQQALRRGAGPLVLEARTDRRPPPVRS